jgi:phage tail sheath protein FI
MPTYLSPGLYLQERSSGAGPVSAVSTSTYATAGWLQKGPENEYRLVTSFESFVSQYGSYWRNSYIPFMMAAFFQNTGARAYVNRVVPSDAVKAANAACFSDAGVGATFVSRVLPATLDLSVNSNIGLAIDAAVAADIDCAGVTANATTPAEIVAILDAVAGISCTLGADNRMTIVSDDVTAASKLTFTEATATDSTPEILGLEIAGAPYVYANGSLASTWAGEAAWKGSYYNQDRMVLSGNPDYADGNGGFTRFDVVIQEESAVGAADWQPLETYEAVILDDDTHDHFIEDVVNPETDYFKITAGAGAAIPRALSPDQHPKEWWGEGDAAETSFSGTLLNAPIHPGSLTFTAGSIVATDDGVGGLSGTGVTSGTINYTTGAFTLVLTAAPAVGEMLFANYYALPVSETVSCQLSGGTNGTVGLTRGDISDPALAATKAGIYAFDDLDEILNISLSDFAGDVPVSNDLIAYGENTKKRFAILTAPMGTDVLGAVNFVRNTAAYNTSYAALYYPWVKIYDPIADDGRSVTVPPDGFIAGVYSRTDSQRNVGKAPAGINDGKLLGAVGLERILNQGERDTLYPARINCLMDTAQTGRAVWGSKTLSLDAEWLQVNVRRLFLFCEQSIYNSLFWAVFENNGPGLWAKETPSEAWQIKVDSDNNPQEAIDAGLLTVDYYIAPNKPAEYIRLRFQQKVNV